MSDDLVPVIDDTPPMREMLAAIVKNIANVQTSSSGKKG